MTCCPASMGICSLPAAAAGSCWGDAPMAPLCCHRPPPGPRAGWGLLAESTGSHSLRSPHPIPLPSYLRARPLSTQAPHPVAPLQNPSPAVSRRGALPPRSLPCGGVSPRSIPAPAGQPRCSPSRGRPGERAVSAHRGRGGCTSPDPLQPIPSDRTSS